MSVQIEDDGLKLLRDDSVYEPKILDLCCGKGGDLRKWNNAKAASVVMTGKLKIVEHILLFNQYL